MMANNTTSNITDVGNYDWFTIVLNVTSSVTFTIGFPINLAIIYLVSRRRSLKTPTNMFVSSLAFADLLVLVWMMIWIICLHTWNETSFIIRHYITSSLDMFLAASSMINVACISADRAIAVIYPLKYETIVTKKRSYIIIFSVWFYSFLLLVAKLLRIAARNTVYNNVALCGGFVSFFVAVAVIVISYSLIFVVIVHKLKGIRVLEKAVSNVVIRLNENSLESPSSRRRHRKFLRELKVTGNILLIVLPFTFAWTYLVGTTLHEAVEQASIQNAAHKLAICVIPWILSALNPIIYLLLNRSLRIAFINTLRKFMQSDPYNTEESRLSFFLTISRRASSALRRPSDNLDDGTGLLKMCPSQKISGNTHLPATEEGNNVETSLNEQQTTTTQHLITSNS